MLTFDVLTIFPELFESFARESLLQKASKKKLLRIRAHDLRKWAKDKHRSVDDKPFGGGLGMVLRIEPVYKAVQSLKSKIQNPKSKTKVIVFTPRGKKFTQAMAYDFSKLNQLIFICPRYEGADERIARHIADVELSIGDYVTMGGEVPAMAVIEAVSRLIPGVVGKPQFLKERLGKGRKKGFLEYPQYTRPEVFLPSEVRQGRANEGGPRKNRGWRVPKVLISGNHKEIEKWKAEHARMIGK